MTESSNTEAGEPTPGVVERLARDDVERKRFLKMAGRRVGAGAAATSLAAFIAACGSASSTATSSGTASGAAAASSSATMGGTSSTGAAGSSSGSGSSDLAIVNYALTLEYLESQFYDKVVKSGLFHGKVLSVLKTFGAEEADHVQALKTVAGQLGTAAMEPTGQVPHPQRGAGHRPGGDGREPRRLRVSGAGGQHQEQGDPGRGALHPQHRSPPCGDAEPAAQEVADPRRRIRQAHEHGPGSGRREAVHRLAACPSLTERNTFP